MVSIALFSMACIGFWFWVYQHPLFAFGFVSEQIETPGPYTIAILELFVYGTEFDAQAQLLTAETWYHNGVLDVILPLLSEHWGEKLRELPVLALGMEGERVAVFACCTGWR